MEGLEQPPGLESADAVDALASALFMFTAVAWRIALGATTSQTQSTDP